MNFLPFLQGAAPQGSLLSMIIPFGAIFVIFYFFMIRPQNKKQKETKKMIDALKKGDKIVTIGGIHGTISSTKESSVIVKVDDNSKIEFLRSAIATVIVDKASASPEKTKRTAKDKKATQDDSNSSETKQEEVDTAKTEE